MLYVYELRNGLRNLAWTFAGVGAASAIGRTLVEANGDVALGQQCESTAITLAALGFTVLNCYASASLAEARGNIPHDIPPVVTAT